MRIGGKRSIVGAGLMFMSALAAQHCTSKPATATAPDAGTTASSARG